MELSEQEHQRIVKEELVRLQLRKEIKLQRRPRLIPLMVFWTTLLILLAYVSPHIHDWFTLK